MADQAQLLHRRSLTGRWHPSSELAWPRLATLHGHLDRARDVDLEGRGYQVWVRRGILLLLAALIYAAVIFSAFGQRSTTSTAASPAATLTVAAPERLRGGLIFEGRMEIVAHQTIKVPRLVLAGGWMEGMTLNSSEPSPSTETSRGGRLILDFDEIPAGTTFTYWSQWSVNPVNVGHRSQDVALYDGPHELASVHRQVTVFP